MNGTIIYIEHIPDGDSWWLARGLSTVFKKAIYIVADNFSRLATNLSPLDLSKFIASLLGQECSVIICTDIMLIKILASYNLGIVVRPQGGKEVGVKCLVYEPQGVVKERDKLMDMILEYLKKEKIIKSL